MKRLVLLFLLSLLIVPAFAQDSKENADFKLAVNLFNDKLYDLALEQFRQFVNLYPNTQQGMDARLYLGLTQTKLGRHDEARVTYQNFALTYPEHPRASEAWMNAAESFVAVKNEREAALAFERVKTFHPKSKNAPVALLRSAELYEQIGERENARRVLRTLTQEYATPDVLPARIRLASLSLADGDYEHARAESRRVADGTKDPGLRSQALILTARALIGMGRMAEANQTLSAVVKEYRTRPNIYEAFALLAELHLMQGHLDESVRTWKTIVDDSAKAPRALRQGALLALGDLAGRAGELAAARQYYLRASAIAAPRAGESTYRAALASEELRDTAAAGASYQRMARDTTVTLDDAKRLVGLFKAARWTRQPRTMLEIAQEHQQRFPRDDTWKHMLVETGFALLDVSDDPELARAVADDLQSRSGNGRWGDAIAFLQARIARRQGNHDKALEFFETFERRYPGSTLIPQAIAAAREIRLFERIDRDAGLQKLASLVGGVIAEESRSLLAFRLGEIYFNELKDYPRAAEGE
ncbi:MAG: tetratricopeptide repeat protein, partial [Bacteroidetes bacterium]|nr:tetratricopeptide repeat protein [Bacteroidota bacterium]